MPFPEHREAVAERDGRGQGGGPAALTLPVLRCEAAGTADGGYTPRCGPRNKSQSLAGPAHRFYAPEVARPAAVPLPPYPDWPPGQRRAQRLAHGAAACR